MNGIVDEPPVFLSHSMNTDRSYLTENPLLPQRLVPERVYGPEPTELNKNGKTQCNTVSSECQVLSVVLSMPF